jgi:hypothetical protein
MNWGKVIAGLLACNAAMLVYLLVMRPARAPIPSSSEPVLVQQSSRTSSPATIAPRADPLTVTVTNDFNWRQLESEDYRGYIQRLRSVGCPESTIHDIIIADLDRLFSPRLRALQPYRENLTYWEPEEEELLNNVNDAELLRQERAVEQEKRAVIKELTGVDLATERLKLKGQEDYYDRRLSFLPEEKRWDVRRALEEYHDQAWAIRQKQLDGYGLDDQSRAELARLRKERDARLDQLLGLEDRKTFDLWLSETASQVRHDVYGMDATEQEFQAIYQARKKFDTQWPRDEIDLENPLVHQRWETAQQQLDQTIRSALGDERFLAYKRGQDPDFHALSALIARFSLPQGVAAEVYGYKQAFLDYRDAVGFDGRLSPEQKQQTLSAIQEETVRVLRDRLGEVAFNQYLPRADWLRN